MAKTYGVTEHDRHGNPVHFGEITKTVKATRKVAKRTRKHAGEFESSNRNTTGKRIARALWG